MLKGLAIVPPTIGRISIGRVVEKNGKRLPEKDDQFTLTTQIQQRGEWLLHPLNETLRKANTGKLRAIPVRFLFNDPDLNLRAEYSCFDRDTGRPVCVGNGESCRRAGDHGIEELPCPSPAACGFGKGGACKPYGRLNVLIGDEDELGCFTFRTTSFNSIRTLAARLHYFGAVSGISAQSPIEKVLRACGVHPDARPKGIGASPDVARANARDEWRRRSSFKLAALMLRNTEPTTRSVLTAIGSALVAHRTPNDPTNDA